MRVRVRAICRSRVRVRVRVPEVELELEFGFGLFPPSELNSRTHIAPCPAAAARFSARASNSAAGALWVPSLAQSLPLPRRSPFRVAHGAAAYARRWRPWRRLSRAAALAAAWRSAAASAAAARSRHARCVVLGSSSSLRVVVGAVASDVGRPGAVDGEGYIPTSAPDRRTHDEVGGARSGRRLARGSALARRRRCRLS